MRLVLPCVLAITVLSSATPSQAQVRQNALTNVYSISVPIKGKLMMPTGTAFTIEIDGRQYLITAKHILGSLKSDGSQEMIQVRKISDTKKWEPVTVKVFPCIKGVDIAVMVLEKPLRTEFPLKPESGQVDFTEEVFFLGFPLNLDMRIDGDEYPYPIAKRGIVASFRFRDGISSDLIDGLNIHGFSGGPVITLHKDNLMYVHAVISGFVPEVEPTVNCRAIRPKESLSGLESWRYQLPSGDPRIDKEGHKLICEDDATKSFPSNAGLASAFNIRHALDVIKEHPIGPEVHEKP